MPKKSPVTDTRILSPIAQAGVRMMSPDSVGTHPMIPAHGGDSPQFEARYPDLYPNAYDVTSKPEFLGWEDISGNTYVVDGHHHLAWAKGAGTFVSSAIVKGQYVPVNREIPVRILRERDGWTAESARAIGLAANYGSEGPVATELLADSDGWEVVEEWTFSADEFELLCDAAKDGLSRVRQFATQANAVNRNERVYPREVLNRAIADAKEFAKAGAMLSEFAHPEIVETRRGQKYTHNPERTSARVDDISDVQPDGKVYITRTILNTPYGRKLDKAYRDYDSGKSKAPPPGISTRFMAKMKQGSLGNRSVNVAQAMRIHTWDDVDTPAVDGAGEFQLLTDSQVEQIGSPSDLAGGTSGHPDTDPESFAEPPLHLNSGDAQHGFNTSNPLVFEGGIAANQQMSAGDSLTVKTRANAHERTLNMNENLKRALSEFRAALDSGAKPKEVADKRQNYYKAIVDAKTSGEDVKEAAAEGMKCDIDMQVAGYRADGPSFQAAMGAEAGDPGKGWAGETEQQPQGPGSTSPVTTVPTSNGTLHNDAKVAELEKTVESLRGNVDQLNAEKVKKQAKKSREKAVADAVTSFETGGKFAELDSRQKEYIKGRVEPKIALLDEITAQAVEDIYTDEIEALAKLLTDTTLKAQGYREGGNGRTIGVPTRDPVNPIRVDRVHEQNPYWPEVTRLMAHADEFARSSGRISVDSSEVQSRRKHNRALIQPLVDEITHQHVASKSAEGWMARVDGMGDDREQAFLDNFCKMAAMSDSTSTSNLYNQASVMLYLLVQSFQDMQMLSAMQVFGPNSRDTGNGGFVDGPYGSVLRIPSEYYTNPTGWGASDTAYDFGLLTPEGSGISEATVNLTWLEFSPAWRRIAASITRDAIRALGQGPANYAAVARHLFHIAWDKSRRVDRAAANEMLQNSDEYGAVTVTESYTTGNSLLPDNSVYAAGGSVRVNLNPAKTAANGATNGLGVIDAGDPSVTYGASVIGALRLKCGGKGTSSPYMGTAAGATPILRRRQTTTLSAAGQPSTTTTFDAAFTAPANTVEGVLNASGDIVSYPGTTATYAIDYENGVVCFASLVIGASGVLTTTVTGTYSFATNFDNFIAINPTLATGQSLANYYNGIFGQFDTSAAAMGSAPRFVKPDFALMSLVASAYLTQAEIFYKLQSPDGTSLFPTEDYFFQRTGILGMRVNVPWNAKDRRIMLGRRGATKYAVQTPFELRGPFQKYDSNGQLIAADAYYGQENSCIASPVVTDQSGNQLNPFSKTLILRSPNG